MSGRKLKLLIVGDEEVGKTSLLITYNTSTFPAENVPTAAGGYCSDIRIDDQIYTIAFWDTAGHSQEDFNRVRPLYYPGTDIVLLAFSINWPDSLHNIKEKWFPEASHFSPGTPCLVVGCKADLRGYGGMDRSGKSDKCVTYKEGSKLARKLGLKYMETSSLAHTGLTECFEYAVRLGVSHEEVSRKSVFSRLPFGRKRHKEVIIPPIMPPAGKAPWLDVETSTFADNWYKALQDPTFYDVTFIVENQRELKAHKIIMCSASSFFAKVLGVSSGVRTNQQRQMSAIDSFSRNDLNSGHVEGIAGVSEDNSHSAHAHYTVMLSADIKASTFLRVLEFLYTGEPRLSGDISDTELEELSRVAGIFKLAHLKTICRNRLNYEKFLNPSIGVFLNEETGATMKTLFFNQPEYSDVIFNVQGTSVYAHRVVLSARSEVMAAMFSGHFSEGNEQTVVKVNLPDTLVDTFLALLEYLYTDHAPIEEGDAIGILILADEYCVPRLGNLCELYITKEVDRQCAEQTERSDIDVIGLLNTAETYNAKHLADWCLHFISTNFTAFERKPEFANLTSHHRKYVTEHRWPPLAYLKEAEEFEKQKAANSDYDKCDIM